MTQGQVNFAASPLQGNGRKMKGASFGRKSFKTLLNIGLQAVAAPRIFPSGGKLGVTWQMSESSN